MQQIFYNPAQSMNAFTAGEQLGERRRKRETQNVFSGMIGNKDYEGARDYAYSRGAMDLGGAADGVLAGQAQQAKTAEKEKARMTYEGLTAISKLPDFDSRLRMATDLSAQLGIAAPDDPNDLSDHELARQLQVLRIQGGFEEAGPDYGFMNVDGVGYRTDPSAGTMTAMTERPPEAPQGPASAIGKIMADREAGIITEEQAQAAIERATAPRGPLSVTHINPSIDEYVSSLLDPEQTRGNDPALVWDENGKLRVSPNAQQSGLNKQALKFNDLAAKRELVQDDISRALELFTVIDPETGIRTVREGQMVVGPSAAIADIPVFGNSTKAGSMEGMLTTIKANVGFDELQAMREASPTGGALGQVSEQEIAFLQALLGDLEQSRDPTIFMYNMERLNTFLDGRQARFKAAFEADYPSAAESIGRESEARNTVEDLVNKYAE
jgi:hypothetical protein